MNVQIIVAVIFALVLGFAITYFVNDWYLTNVEIKKWKDLFYSQNFDPTQKKIYLVGASQVHRINATLVENYISQTEKDYKIFNLGIPGDTPARRNNDLEKMIQTNPVMVVYGLTFRDFQSFGKNEIPITDVIAATKPVDGLPEPWELLYDTKTLDNIIDFSNFNNPQVTTLKLFEHLTNPASISEKKPDLENTPFSKYEPSMSKIKNQEQIEIDYKHKLLRSLIFSGYGTDEKDLDATTLKKIIAELKKNKIQVVLFSIPYPKYYLDGVEKSEIEIFTSILDEISNEFDVKVYHFYDKYPGMNIWADVLHVSLNKTSTIYSSDIAKIILQEIKS